MSATSNSAKVASGMRSAHPREVLLGAQGVSGVLPVCDHYSGVEARMRKSLQLQADLSAHYGTCVMDVTLDCEDGAPVGGEHDHAQMVLALAKDAQAKSLRSSVPARIAVRVHPVDHPAFESDVATLVGGAASLWCHVMIPKVESLADVQRAAAAVDAAAQGAKDVLPLHALIESPAAVHRAFDIAAHPRVQSLSFGLMDFVSAHGGAIPASAMSFQPAGSEPDQFSHPLVLRSKLAIASACHAHGKVPSHCVVTEFKDPAVMAAAARKAARELGFTRMWSIHPDQIAPILQAMSPSDAEIEQSARIIEAAVAAQWAPVSDGGQLHDRASYRYFWQVLERAHQTGRALPSSMQAYFSAASVAEGIA
jgi:citrate lyase subunit beta / citryl-CoA lyase